MLRLLLRLTAMGRLWGDGFEVETLIHVRVAKAGLVVAEVPSFEYARIHGASSLNAFGDGLRVLRAILTERLYIWRLPAIAANPPPIRKLSAKATPVAHECTASSRLIAGPEQRAPQDRWQPYPLVPSGPADE